jgi:tRNA pseudouridine32 synthase / 23S rRNA pseudouridine746 synthase
MIGSSFHGRTYTHNMTQIKPVPASAIPPALSEAEIQQRVLYRDALMLVIDKPAGMPVHVGPGKAKGPNLEMSFDFLRYGLPRRPALAHRLDKDTSGCLVLGRHTEALRRLGEMFQQNKIEKIYWAVVRGTPEHERGQINQPLLRVPLRPEGGLGFRMRPDPTGQDAVTDWRVLKAYGDLTLLELKPQTGRTHQLRVHCQIMGWPIVGDRLYGLPQDQKPDAPMMHLHAHTISVPLYPKKPTIRVTAPLPEHMAAYCTDLQN